MEKLLLKKLGFILIILSAITVTLLSGVVFIVKSKEAVSNLNDILEEVEESYDQSLKSTKETEELFKKDYLNRAYTTDFILNNQSEKGYDQENLKKIKDLMELESINLIDENGKIVVSSESYKIGLDLHEYDNSAPFLELIQKEDKDANVIQFDTVSMINNEKRVYIGIKTNSEKYSIIQIGIDGDVFDNLVDNKSIQSIIENMPTLRAGTVFIVDRDSGEIEGITRNNEQTITFKNADTKEGFISSLDFCNSGKIITINGKMRYIKTKQIGDKIIGAYEDTSLVYAEIMIQILSILVTTSIIFVVIMMIFKYYFRRYVLKDLRDISDNIKELMRGNYNVVFKTEYDTEFKDISSILNDWKESYRHKTDRMTKIMSVINERVAVFECLYPINQNFFSDNMKSILGVQEAVWNEIKKTPKQFKDYIESTVSSNQREDELIKVNDKFLSFAFFEQNDGLYGMVMDKTEEVELKEQMQQQLRYVQIESETDSLTKVANRSGFEKYVKMSLENDNSEGIMLIFDLDNFKTVNDKAGHPVGDEVLKQFASCLRKYFRSEDIVGRIGGDEFVVFIGISIHIDVLINKLDRLLEGIRSRLKEYHEKYNLSTSIGVSYVNSEINEYETLYKAADAALYKAKRFGKDRYCINEESVQEEDIEYVKSLNNCNG